LFFPGEVGFVEGCALASGAQSDARQCQKAMYSQRARGSCPPWRNFVDRQPSAGTEAHFGNQSTGIIADGH